jgi:uncharacterized coiled-coil protein SlyX
MTIHRSRSVEELAQAIVAQQVQIEQKKKRMPMLMPNFELPTAQMKLDEMRQQPVKQIHILE